MYTYVHPISVVLLHMDETKEKWVNSWQRQTAGISREQNIARIDFQKGNPMKILELNIFISTSSNYNIFVTYIISCFTI